MTNKNWIRSRVGVGIGAMGAVLAGAVSFALASAENARADGYHGASAALIAASCYSCHGTDGKSRGAMPSINGKSADFISGAMLAFKDGKRPATVMNRIAKGYSETEIHAVAQYLGALK